MRSILNELIGEIEGCGEEPRAAIRGFRQDSHNPNYFYLEIEDLRKKPDGEEAKGAENETN